MIHNTQYTRIIPVILVLLTHCSEPPPPGPAPPPAADTTTHDYTWEYHLFGQDPIESSWFRDIYVESDDNFWIVGDVQVDTFVTSPSGDRTRRVTAIHWDGHEFTPHAIEGVLPSGNIRTVAIEGVEGRNGSVYFIAVGSCTEIRRDTTVVHDLRVLAGRWWSQHRVDKFRSGRMYIYGGPGFAAELVQDKPLGPISFRQIPLSTELPVRTFAEVAADDYYLGIWSTERPDYHFWRHYNGEVIPLHFAADTLGPRDVCAALWASEDYLFAANSPYLFRQSIRDTSDRVFIPLRGRMDPAMRTGIPNRMVGRANNDIFIVGDFGTIYHFNGKSSHLYTDLMSEFRMVRYLDVAVTETKVYIVGGGFVDGQSRAILMIGTRQ
jgi:hypothetical protein